MSFIVLRIVPLFQLKYCILNGFFFLTALHNWGNTNVQTLPIAFDLSQYFILLITLLCKKSHSESKKSNEIGERSRAQVVWGEAEGTGAV